ncbi:hypothetical protein P3G55_20750 [Leptospira sp. 96542]|nr:hypothetical protein [Leptospira sp. 96542]
MSQQPQFDDSALNALKGMTAEVDAANPDPAQQAEQQAQEEAAQTEENEARDWGLLMYTVGGFAIMIAPELKPVYSEENCMAWGRSANAVSKKYGFSASRFGPEMALIGSTVGFALPTFFAVRARILEARKPGAQGWLAKAGLWWRSRKARKSMAAQAQQEQAAGQGDGGQQ